MRPTEFIPKKKLIMRPKCPACGALMWLARVEPGEPDHDKRTFECPRCQDELTELVKYR
jgi:transposase-like protein